MFQYLVYGFPVAFLAMMAFRFYQFQKVKKMIPFLVKEGAQFIDVRTAEEFKLGSRLNSINIPLDQLQKNLEKISHNKPVILSCRSGNRSGVALRILKSKGFTQVYNAGPWTNTL